MQSPSSYREIKLVNGQKVNQIKNLNQKEWMKVCEKLGLYVAPENGKGSHCAVYQSNVCPPENRECCVLTIPRNVFSNFQRDLVKKLVFYGVKSGKYNEDDVWNAIGL